MFRGLRSEEPPHFALVWPQACAGELKIDKAVGSAVRETVVASLDLQGSRGPVFFVVLFCCLFVCFRVKEFYQGQRNLLGCLPQEPISLFLIKKLIELLGKPWKKVRGPFPASAPDLIVLPEVNL